MCCVNEMPIKHAPCQSEKHSALVRLGCVNSGETELFSRSFFKNG